MGERDDFERTIGYGETALDHLKQHVTPAYPRNYELWYTYAAGFNRALNRAVNGIIRSRGRLSGEDLQHIYNAFLSPSRLGVRIEEVGGRVSQEISALAELIDNAIGSTSHYGSTLRDASEELNSSGDAEEIQQVIRRLLASTLEVDANNRRLEGQLEESRKELETLQAGLEAIRHETLTDQLTSLANRKHFDQSLERAFAEADPNTAPLALALADIDNFKRFNDTFGHQTGDQVLRLVAMAVKQTVKGQDIACRYGGEEFAIILPRTTLKQARVVGEHIREAVMAKELMKRSTGQNLGRMTISVGVSAFRAGDSIQTLIERADSCLYAAKHAGRNLVVSEADELYFNPPDRSVA